MNRKRFYHHKTRETSDLLIKQEIDNLLIDNPAYGHKRVAMALGYGHNKALRIMNKYGIKPPRRKAHKLWLTKGVSNHHYTNLIKGVFPVKPNQIFVSDLTYLEYQSRFIYLATVEDIFTREIVSANISDKHDSPLAFSVIKQAISNSISHPEIFHSDQGSEFMAEINTSFLEKNKVLVSVSDKGCPWQNGYKESFFGRFKDENGDLTRFNSLGELIEEIYSFIYYYNHLRIHTSLKMSPLKFKQLYLEGVSEKTGT